MLALRTLETWVDNLNPEYLEPAMSEVVQDLMTALWALLKPSNQLAPKVKWLAVQRNKPGCSIHLGHPRFTAR